MIFYAESDGGHAMRMQARKLPEFAQNCLKCGFWHSNPAVVGRKSGLPEMVDADSCIVRQGMRSANDFQCLTRLLSGNGYLCNLQLNVKPPDHLFYLIVFLRTSYIFPALLSAHSVKTRSNLESTSTFFEKIVMTSWRTQSLRTGLRGHSVV